jgi:hypothetical protein
MAMSEEAQRTYDDVLRRLVLKHGELVAVDGTYWGWLASDWRHKHSCELSSTAVPREETWGQFDGTFADCDLTVHGIVLDDVHCACGYLVRRQLCWEKPLGEVLRAMFEQLVEDVK